jgi:hypothetical protein
LRETGLKELPRIELEIENGNIFAKGFSVEPLKLSQAQDIQSPQGSWAV